MSEFDVKSTENLNYANADVLPVRQCQLEYNSTEFIHSSQICARIRHDEKSHPAVCMVRNIIDFYQT